MMKTLVMSAMIMTTIMMTMAKTMTLSDNGPGPRQSPQQFSHCECQKLLHLQDL